MPAQRDPGHYTVTPKKPKKKPPPVPEAAPPLQSSYTPPSKKEKKRVQRTTPDVSVTAVGGGKEVKQTQRATTRTASQADKRYGSAKAAHKKIRVAKAFRGTLKNPRSRAEKQAAAKGKTIQNILKTDPDYKYLYPSTRFQHSDPDAVIAASIANIKKAKDDAKSAIEDRPTAGSQRKEGTAKLGPGLKRDEINKATIAKSNLEISKLQVLAAKRTKQDIHDYIKTLQSYKGKPNVDNKKLHKEIERQRDQLTKINSKQHTIQKKLPTQLGKYQDKKHRLAHGQLRATVFLSQTEGDPINLNEAGYRTRGEYEDTMAKYPGVPGWFSVEAARPSSPLEDAADMAQWFPGVGLALKGLGLAGKGVSAVVRVGGKGASEAAFGAGAVAAARNALPASLAAYGEKGLAQASKVYLAGKGVLKPVGKALRYPGARASADVNFLTKPIRGAASKGLGKVGQVGGDIKWMSRALPGAKGLSKVAPTLNGFNVAIKSAISRGTPQLFKGLIKRGKGIVTRSGGVIEKNGEVVGEEATKDSLLVSSAIDDSFMVGAKKTATKVGRVTDVPQIGPYKLAARTAVRKGVKGAAIYGTAAGVPQLIQGKSVPDAASTIYRDAHDFVVGVVPATFMTGAAGWEALHGDMERMDVITSDFMKYDPIGLAIQGKWQEALDAYNERPFSTALELSGLEYGIARTAGGAVRAVAPKGGTVAKAFGTERFAQVGPADTLGIDVKGYSPDPIRKLMTRGGESIINLGAKRNKTIRNYRQGHVNREALRAVNRKVDSLHVEHNNMMLKIYQDTFEEHAQIQREIQKLYGLRRNDHTAGNALPFMLSRIARNPKSAVDDLTEYRNQLVDKAEKIQARHYSGQGINVETELNLKLTLETEQKIKEILEHPERLEDQRLWDIADRYKAREDKVQVNLYKHSNLTPNQIEAAAWIPYLVRHLGGRKVSGKGKGAKDHSYWETDVHLPTRTNGKFANRPLDLTNPADVRLIADYAKDNNVAEPAFIRLQGLRDVDKHTKGLTGVGPSFYSRAGKGIENGTFDPTFGALFSHRMRVAHTIQDTQHVSRLVNQFATFREFIDRSMVDPETGGPMRLGYRLDEKGALQELQDSGIIDFTTREPVPEGLVAAREEGLGSVREGTNRTIEDREPTSRSEELSYFEGEISELKEQKGKPGISIEQRSNVADFGDEGPAIVYRNENGDPVGLMLIDFEHDIEPQTLRATNINRDKVDSISLSVHPDYQRQRIATQMGQAALEAKIPIYHLGSNVFTQKGAATRTGLLNKAEELMPVDEPGLDALRHTPVTGTRTQMERLIDREHEAGNIANKDNFVAFNIDGALQELAALRGMGDGIKSTNVIEDSNPMGAFRKATEAGEKSTDSKANSFVVMPKAVMNRVNAHSRVDDLMFNNEIGRAARKYNSYFKGSVLPFNFHWGLGNMVDMTFRMMMDTNPATAVLNYRHGRKLLKELEVRDPNGHAALLSMIGHGFISSAHEAIIEDRALSTSLKRDIEERLMLQRQWKDYWDASPRQRAAQTQRAVAIQRGLGSWVKSATHTTGAAYRRAQEINPAGFGLQRIIEKQFRTAALGKADKDLVRDLQNNVVEGTLMTQQVIEDTTKRLTNTTVQHALAERINNVLGDYSRMSPTMRLAVSTYAPFALWIRASTHWVMTLPKNHPFRAGVLAAANRVDEIERRDAGFSALHPVDYTKEAGVKGQTPTKPGYLIGALRLGDVMYPTGSLSSFGTFSDSLSSTFGRVLVPQITSAGLAGIWGLNWTGEEMIRPDGAELTGGQKIGAGLSALIETYMPLARWYKIWQAEGSPDESATIFDPMPEDASGKGRRNTEILPYKNAHRYEDPAKDTVDRLLQTFSPFKTLPMDPADAPESTTLPPATAGPTAYSAGKDERGQNKISDIEDRYGDIGVKKAQKSIDAIQGPPPKQKPPKGWLDDIIEQQSK